MSPKVVAHGQIEATVAYRYSVDNTLDIGQDWGTPILADYANKLPSKYNGKIETVVIELQ